VDLLSRQPGVEEPPQIVAAVAARLTAIDGAPLRDLSGWARRFRGNRTITWSATVPLHTQVVSGAWWQSDHAGEPLVSVEEDAAKVLNIGPGARLDWEAGGRKVSARVAAVHRPESIRPESSIEFILSPGALAGFPALHFGGMRVRARDVPALQRAAYERYPTVTVINSADVLAIVQEVVDEIALVVRFVAFFAILAGVVILASSVAGTRFRRIREVVILKTLGATRRRVAQIFSVEFLVLGAVGGLIGGLLATIFAAILMERELELNYRLDLVPVLLAIVLTALLANLAGWAASFRILGQKPLEALRREES
jgi:putative ABC transport system permease protein